MCSYRMSCVVAYVPSEGGSLVKPPKRGSERTAYHGAVPIRRKLLRRFRRNSLIFVLIMAHTRILHNVRGSRAYAPFRAELQ